MVEERTNGDALAHHIVSREVDTEGSGATRCLCGVDINLTNERSVVVKLQIEIESQVIINILLLLPDFEH